VYPQLLQLGPLPLHTYGLLVAIAFLTGLLIASRLAARAGLDSDKVANLGIYVAVAAIGGAKVFMVVTDWPYYSRNPGQIFSLATLQAGGVFFGGLIAALVVAAWYLRRSGLPALETADTFAPAIALGHSVGRLGCFLAGCCWGRPTEALWGVTFTKPLAHELVGVPLNVRLHPTQLYEAAAELLIFGLLWLRFRRPHRPGSVIGLYLLLYSAFRFAIEFLRDPADRSFPLGGPLSVTQWLALLLMAAGTLLLTRTRKARVAAACLLLALPARSQQDPGRRQYESLCSSCHGADGAGGERGPGIVLSPRSRSRSEKDLRDLIRNGIPNAGMPGFPLAEEPLGQLAAFVRSLAAPAVEHPTPGDAAAGQRFFFGPGGCSGCHLVGGRGGRSGPDLTDLAQQRSLPQIQESLRDPSRRIVSGYAVVSARLRDGGARRGFARLESAYDLQLQDLEGAFHSLARDQIASLDREKDSLMPPLRASDAELRDLLAYLTRGPLPSSPHPLISSSAGPSRAGDWPTYHGQWSGNRHSPLDQIHPGNVATLAPRWIFSIPDSRRLQVTPLVIDGVMYVTAANEAYALDARSGRQLWHFRRPRTKGLVGDAASGINRGVAVLGDRVFLVTDHAHLLALDRLSGGLVWDVEMADYRKHYGATSAPLVVKDLVISGISGGDEGARGFLDAYRASTGERVWRFWTIPAPGEPASETWIGRDLEHGCGTTWLTGAYDPSLDLIYWPTGNPCPDYDGDQRKGDNLYTSSVLALEAATGKLRWYYQYTPHDVHDWDAQQTPMLIDAGFRGRPRRLLAQANRNGFFYVLDRTNGELLLASPFVKKLTWASGIGPDGRPQLLPGAVPTPEGVKACPAVEGATNWMSTAFNPVTRLFYVMALEKCNIYTRRPEIWKPGQSFYGGNTRNVAGEPGKKYLRALDLESGRIVWEHPQIGPGNTWGGVLSTASGLVFFGDDSGAFAAVDARTGKPLWHFHTSQLWKASPMTYIVDSKQYVAVAAGTNILAFGLP